MQFEEFREFMLQSAAQHNVRIAQIEESLNRITNTVGRLVDNQVYLQEKFDATQDQIGETQQQIRETQQQLRELAGLVIRHVSDPDAHKP
ncbi:MAG: hypothetical protein ACKV22_18050 [Bryobacteraceae bacterium]